MILTETFLTEDIELQGYYAIHALATPTEGRPAGGVTCFIKGRTGDIEGITKEENMIIVQTSTVTIIGIYIQPSAPIENIIDKISTAIEQTKADKNVILAGDFNCRLDKETAKTHILLETLEEEGFKIANTKDTPTYFAQNGHSTIDLVFFKGENLKLIKQNGLWNSAAAPIRKHIPIMTSFHMKIPQTRKEANGPNIYTRQIQQEVIKLNEENIEKARDLIEEGKLEEALEISTQVMKKAIK
ncbi:hypothetical protein L9F63_007643, partial [Diploptera punctata]